MTGPRWGKNRSRAQSEIRLRLGPSDVVDDRIVGHSAKYMRALKSKAHADGRPGARLLIVTGQPDESLADSVQVHADKLGVPTQWLLYNVSISLTEA